MKNLKFQGVKNIRDFSGMINTEGKQVKEGLFIRSSALSNLSMEDIRCFQEQYHLSTIIDLRTEAEYEERPDVMIMGAAHHHISVLAESTRGISHEKKTDEEMVHAYSDEESAASSDLEKTDADKEKGKDKEPHRRPDMHKLYRRVAESETSAARLKEVFATILELPGDGACLWHCSEGKDRCGIVSAWFLFLLDFDMEAIFEDYLFTNKAAAAKSWKYYAAALLQTGDKAHAAAIRDMYIVKASYLETYFDAIREKYGSLEDFAEQQLGVTEEMKTRLKAYALQ